MAKYKNNKGEDEMEKTGVFSKDLWKLYHLFPTNSCVAFEFYADVNDKEPVKNIVIWKESGVVPPCHPTGLPTHEEGEQELYDFIGVYGFGPYHIDMVWNHGFGNSIRIRVFPG